MIDAFLIRAALAGLGLAVAAAPLGCFVVWRRMAYFGDATAHAAMLGVAVALFAGMPIFFGALLLALAMALAVSKMTGPGHAADTVLGVLAHSALAVGLVAVSFLSGVRVDLMAYLFGDILAVTRGDLLLIWGGAGAVVALTAWRWSALILATLNADLARASGLEPRREETVLMLALALVVAVAIKIVGVLLIAAMLIIPPAAARPFARTPEAMALIAGGIGAASVLGGLWAAFRFDTPTGPTMVCVAAGLFALSHVVRGARV